MAEKKTTALHFRDAPSTVQRLRERAAAEERSVSDVVRRLLRRALAEDEKKSAL